MADAAIAPVGDASLPDAAICSLESDDALCARLHLPCGTNPVTDACGNTRDVLCGCPDRAECRTGTCVCSAGYTGDPSTGCNDVDECPTNNGGCDPLTTCTNTVGSRTCGACPAGYTGTGALGCTDIDECLVDNGGCDPRSTCTNTPGSRTCGPCPKGYTELAGAGCVDVDECQDAHGGCDPLSTCTNTPGSHYCGPCPLGYKGSGATGCKDIDECVAGNGGCDPLSTCTNLPGSYSCGACPAGFSGTGETGCLCTVGLSCSADGSSVLNCQRGSDGKLGLTTTPCPDGCESGECVDREWTRWPLGSEDRPASQFIVNTDTVVDTLTGLEWQKAFVQNKNWWDARLYCSQLNVGAETGWRLPTRIELLSLVDDDTFASPAVNPAVLATGGSIWTSTISVGARVGVKPTAWVMSDAPGSTGIVLMTDEANVRCVR
ncbi:MAG TPA: EGF domain-containing protein [Myxococcales bacterium]